MDDDDDNNNNNNNNNLNNNNNNNLNNHNNNQHGDRTVSFSQCQRVTTISSPTTWHKRLFFVTAYELRWDK